MLCDYNSHQYINLEGKFISLSKKYCEYLKDNFLQILDEKYNQVIKKMVLFAEWVYFVSGLELLTPDDKTKLRVYIRAVTDCKEGKCLEFCGNLKPFGYSDMFEGELDIVTSFITNLRLALDKLFVNRNQFFKVNPNLSTTEEFQEYMDTQSVTKPLKDEGGGLFDSSDDDLV